MPPSHATDTFEDRGFTSSSPHQVQTCAECISSHCHCCVLEDSPCLSRGTWRFIHVLCERSQLYSPFAEGDLLRKAVLFSLGLVPPPGLGSVLQHRPQLQHEPVHYKEANWGKESRINLLLFLPCDTAPWPGHSTGDEKQDLKQPCMEEGRLWNAVSTYCRAEDKSWHQGEHIHPLLSAVQSRKATQRQGSPS